VRQPEARASVDSLAQSTAPSRAPWLNRGPTSTTTFGSKFTRRTSPGRAKQVGRGGWTQLEQFAVAASADSAAVLGQRTAVARRSCQERGDLLAWRFDGWHVGHWSTPRCLEQFAPREGRITSVVGEAPLQPAPSGARLENLLALARGRVVRLLFLVDQPEGASTAVGRGADRRCARGCVSRGSVQCRCSSWRRCPAGRIPSTPFVFPRMKEEAATRRRRPHSAEECVPGHTAGVNCTPVCA